MQDTAGEVGTSSLMMYSYGPLHMAEQKQGDIFFGVFKDKQDLLTNTTYTKFWGNQRFKTVVNL